MRQRAITWVMMALLVMGMAVSFPAHSDESAAQLVATGGVAEKSSSFFSFVPNAVVNFVNSAVDTFKGAVNYVVAIVTPRQASKPQTIVASVDTKPVATYVPPVAMSTPLPSQVPSVAIAPEVAQAATPTVPTPPALTATTAAAAIVATNVAPDTASKGAPTQVAPLQVAASKVITIQKGSSAAVAPQVPSTSASATVAAALNSVVPVKPSGTAAAPVAPSTPVDALGLKNVAGAPDAAAPASVSAAKPAAPVVAAAPTTSLSPVVQSSGNIAPVSSPARATSSPAPAPVQTSAFQPMAPIVSAPLMAAPAATVASAPAPAPVAVRSAALVATPAPTSAPVVSRPVAATLPTTTTTTATRPITTTTASPTRVVATAPVIAPLTAPIDTAPLPPVDRTAAATLPPPPPSPRCVDVTYATANRVACNCPVHETGLGTIQPVSDGQRHAVMVDTTAGKVMIDVKSFLQDALNCTTETTSTAVGSFFLPQPQDITVSNVYVTPEGRIFAVGTSAGDPHTLSILVWTVGSTLDTTTVVSRPLPEFLQTAQAVRGLLISKNVTSGGTNIDIAFGLTITHCDLARDDTLTCTPPTR